MFWIKTMKESYFGLFLGVLAFQTCIACWDTFWAALTTLCFLHPAESSKMDFPAAVDQLDMEHS